MRGPLAALIALASLAHVARAWECSAGGSTLTVSETTGAYSVAIAGSPWLTGGSVSVRSSGETLSSLDGSLRAVKSTQGSGRRQGLGTYGSLDVEWSSAAGFEVTTSFLCYSSGMAEFELRVPAGAEDTNTTFVAANGPAQPGAPPVTEFPSFSAADSVLGSELRHLTHAGPWTLYEWWGTGINSGPLGSRGPLYLLNGTYAGSGAGELPQVPTVAVLSPGNHFTGQQWFVDRTAKKQRLSLGALNTATSIPAGYNTSAVLWSGSRGLTTEAYAWGELLQAAYGTERIPRERDLVRDKLSAWTDNGAVYFQSFWDAHCPTRNCTAVGNTTAEATLRAWHAYLEREGVPVGITQLDTWWFVQGADVGFNAGGIDCADWRPRPDLFPSGLRNLTSSFPLVLYAWGFVQPRYGQRMLNYTWEPQLLMGQATTQDKAMVALDQVEAFYSEIRDRFLALGGSSFEQDNMGQMTQNFRHSIDSVDGAQRWFDGFASPFCEAGIPVQVCEASPADVMETLRHGCITNSRDNIDHVPGEHTGPFVKRWHVGFDRVLLGALGLSPFFDNVWTMPTQPGSTWGPARETYLELSWALSVLGAGPVGIGDIIHNTNATLVRTAHALDGTLLSPSRPSAYVDDVYLDPAAAPFNVTAGRLFQAPSFVPSSKAPGAARRLPGAAPAGTTSYFSVLAVDIDADYDLPLAQLAPRPEADTFLAVPWTPGLNATADGTCRHGAPLGGCARRVGPSFPLPLRTGKAAVAWDHDFELWALSPAPCGGGGGLVLLGELGKMVKVSPRRFSAVDTTCGAAATLDATVTGSPGEVVDVAVAWTGAGAAVARARVVVSGGGSESLSCTAPAGGSGAPTCSS